VIYQRGRKVSLFLKIVHQKVSEFRIQRMEKDIDRLIKTFDQVSVPQGLRDVVFARIHREELRLARIRLAFFAPLVFLSGWGVVASALYVIKEVAQSGFLQYVSIIFSDSSAVFAYAGEFLLSLAEQAPLLGIAIFLATLFTLLESMRGTMKNMQTMLATA